MGAGKLYANYYGIARIDVPRGPGDVFGVWPIFVFGLLVPFSDPNLALLGLQDLKDVGLGFAGPPATNPAWKGQPPPGAACDFPGTCLYTSGRPSLHDPHSSNGTAHNGHTKRYMPLTKNVPVLFAHAHGDVDRLGLQCYSFLNGNPLQLVQALALLA